jgi:hypothetical protein
MLLSAGYSLVLVSHELSTRPLWAHCRTSQAFALAGNFVCVCECARAFLCTFCVCVCVCVCMCACV